MDRKQYEKRVAALKQRFPYQFRGMPYYMVSIDPGWIEVIEEACARIDAALTESEKQIFRWLQIKEKFAGLRLYWEGGPLHVDFMHPEGRMHFEVDPTEPPRLSEAIRKEIAQIIAEAAGRAETLCQVCGKPGQLRQRENGWMITACDAHVSPRQEVWDGD